MLLQRLRLPQHDYYLTLGWSGGKFCIHERQLEEREQIVGVGLPWLLHMAASGPEYPVTSSSDITYRLPADVVS